MLPCSQRALILVLELMGNFGMIAAMASVNIVCMFKFQAFMLRSDQRFHHVCS